MIQFDIITIFPEIFDSYFHESIIKRAQKRKLIKIKIHNLRDSAKDVHKTVDDRPYGGGAGMIFKVDIIFKAVKSIVQRNKRITKKQRKIILLSAKGKKFDQKMAGRLSKLKQIIFICGRYEGVDERVAKHIADEEISIGDYVLTGGEIPAMVILDTVSRLIPGVIKKGSLKEESFSTGLKEYPQYTRPEIFKPGKNKRSWNVPKILLSGHHKKIKDWQEKHSKKLEK
jgi:tRNA (guanine37-N1)-methyltransferase